MKDNRKNPWNYLFYGVIGAIIGALIGYYAFNSPTAGGAIGAGLLIAGFLLFGGPGARHPETEL